MKQEPVSIRRPAGFTMPPMSILPVFPWNKSVMICQNKKYSYQRTAFWDWVKTAEKSGIPEFEKCAKTYRNWSEGILNAFKYKYTNHPTEGYNISY